MTWDDPDLPRGNTRHIEAAGITPEEAESVILDPESEAESRSTGRPIAFGWTDSGKFVALVHEFEEHEDLGIRLVRVVTAYEVEP